MKTTERIIRVVLAFVIFAAGFYFESLWGLVGLIPLLTGAFGFCPLYVWTGRQACPLGACPISKKDKEQE
ncbi:DUF2892 domain-containing protein [Helicobacter typhlonius]|uniref:YgaP family membrane protein n=1 Tax=Helicobacter typhlonius TaxID=76936 RepID=UPI002FE1DFC0